MSTPTPVRAGTHPGTAPHFLWSDLVARRSALGLRREELAQLLRIDAGRYWSVENGDRSTGALLVVELVAMESFVATRTQHLVDAAPTGPTRVVLTAVADQAEFTRSYPSARTQRHAVPYPPTLEHVAVGRAAAELTRRGYDVEIYRGENRFDLRCRRLACGLLKNETAALLGMSQKKYNSWEGGGAVPPAGIVDELQAVDDLIALAAGEVRVTAVDDVPVVLMLNSRADFEETYPQARSRRDGNAYPVRVHWVAAARRARVFDHAGTPARIWPAQSQSAA